MDSTAMSLTEREDVLTRYLEKYLKRGYIVISRSPTSAELNRPARFPARLFPEKIRFIEIDDFGEIHVHSGSWRR
ncbi:MAG: hypothetical protein EYC68_07335 [Chloroflexota bacterium]|nr:MAG: hypothetical protein EYC68_07335 [Chloroflexota bacterium]